MRPAAAVAQDAFARGRELLVFDARYPNKRVRSPRRVPVIQQLVPTGRWRMDHLSLYLSDAAPLRPQFKPSDPDPVAFRVVVSR